MATTTNAEPRTMRLAAVGDLHVTRQSGGTLAPLFAQAAKLCSTFYSNIKKHTKIRTLWS